MWPFCVSSMSERAKERYDVKLIKLYILSSSAGNWFTQKLISYFWLIILAQKIFNYKIKFPFFKNKRKPQTLSKPS